MREELLNMLEAAKGKAGYNLEYFGEQIEVNMDQADVEVIVDCAIRLMDEVKRLGEEGILSKEIIVNRIEELDKKRGERSRTFYDVITGFANGGIYDNDVFHEVARTTGEAVGYELGSTYWMLIGSTKVLSGILSVVEGYFLNEDKENVYESCVWIYIRSCMYIKYGMMRG